ncbi:MAG: winged helix-turn-helix transcriptional regulator [Dehalococcoidales bacterium]|nr:winged helix-turn-helix transcriptional regulator [Dehalococcoidales bacterium]
MPQVLRNKNLATRFQIMVEIAAKQPYIQQKDIAQKIGVTSQAVSEYINALEKDGWLTADGRSVYRLTKEGVNWLLKALRELQQYANETERTLTKIMTWAAIAETKIEKGQKVGLAMKEGLLVATPYKGKGAHGIATVNAAKGEDVGVSNIEDIVALEIGKVTVIEVPDIQSGGSSKINQTKLQTEVDKVEFVGVLGVEALISMRRLNLKPDYVYGVIHAAIEAARSGLSFAIVCTAGESPLLTQKLTEENINYKLVDARKR